MGRAFCVFGAVRSSVEDLPLWAVIPNHARGPWWLAPTVRALQADTKVLRFARDDNSERTREGQAEGEDYEAAE
jgi:hypothetical protein